MKTNKFKKLHGTRAWSLLVKPLIDDFGISEEAANIKIHNRIVDFLFVLRIKDGEGLVRIRKIIASGRKWEKQQREIGKYL